MDSSLLIFPIPIYLVLDFPLSLYLIAALSSLFLVGEGVLLESVSVFIYFCDDEDRKMIKKQKR